MGDTPLAHRRPLSFSLATVTRGRHFFGLFVGSVTLPWQPLWRGPARRFGNSCRRGTRPTSLPCVATRGRLSCAGLSKNRFQGTRCAGTRRHRTVTHHSETSRAAFAAGRPRRSLPSEKSISLPSSDSSNGASLRKSCRCRKMSFPSFIRANRNPRPATTFVILAFIVAFLA